ncbi:hypothetical protein ACROYT_G034377 [Oculina patagonica]
MEALPFLLVTLLALCMMPSALSLECYECTNSPGMSVFGITSCDSNNVKKRTCDAISDRCLVMKYNFSLGGLATLPILMKNCSSSLACDPQFDYSWCKVFGITDLVSNCTMGCCQGDLCNEANTIPTQPPPTNAVLGLAMSFGAICSALVLTVFAGFN